MRANHPASALRLGGAGGRGATGFKLLLETPSGTRAQYVLRNL